MADIFLRSTTGNDGNAGTDKGSPKATLVSALTAAGAGGRVYVSDIHAESLGSGSMNLVSPGTSTSRTLVLCVPDWGSDTGTTAPTSESTGATVTLTTAGGVSMTMSGYARSTGVSYISSHIITVTGAWDIDAPEISIGTTNNASARFNLGQTGNNPPRIRVKIGTLRFGGNSGQRMTFAGGNFEVTIGALAGTMPTILMEPAGLTYFEALIRDSDFVATSGDIWNLAPSQSPPGFVRFLNCKFHASADLTVGTQPGQQMPVVEFINYGSGDTNYQYARVWYPGSDVADASVFRNSGASDGTTPISRRLLVNVASAQWPLRSQWIEFWNETVGSPITVSIATLTDGVTLTDKEAWIEVEYLGTSGFPLGVETDDRNANPILGTGANQATDSVSTWTESLGSPVKQLLSVDITPQEKGIVRARIAVSRSTLTTMYFNPKVLDGSGRQYQLLGSFVNEGAGGGGDPGTPIVELV